MDDAIDDAAVAEDRRLGYPSRHDWNWMPTLGDSYGDWLDAAYPMINRLARERDEARAACRLAQEAFRTAIPFGTNPDDRDRSRAAIGRASAAVSAVLGVGYQALNAPWGGRIQCSSESGSTSCTGSSP